MNRKQKGSIKQQVKKKASNDKKQNRQEYDTDKIISTGSTLLDLAISGGVIRGGGLPPGIFVEIFGSSGSGKTVMLSEIAGAVQNKGGDVMFHDPEARLNKQFAQIFDFDVDASTYNRPSKVSDVFLPILKWEPEDTDAANGIFADSLAALSTELEMENDEGDKMGMKRAKEFSEWLRRTCRHIAENEYLMVASNQIRQTANQFGPKFKSPGGEAIGFYSSVRLKTDIKQKIKKKKTVANKEVTRIIGVETEIEVFKNSVWKPYRTAPLHIDFGYGIDNIRTNLDFVKRYTGNTVYVLNDRKLDKSIEKSIAIVEEEELEDELKEQVIDLWEEIESKFESNRKKKKR
jgi:protein RecA